MMQELTILNIKLHQKPQELGMAVHIVFLAILDK